MYTPCKKKKLHHSYFSVEYLIHLSSFFLNFHWIKTCTHILIYLNKPSNFTDGQYIVQNFFLKSAASLMYFEEKCAILDVHDKQLQKCLNLKY